MSSPSSSSSSSSGGKHHSDSASHTSAHHSESQHTQKHHRAPDWDANQTSYQPEGTQAPPEKTWKQNPMIPAAVLGGGVALALAVILGGNKSKTISQRAMEARVLAQGTAVAGLFAAGMYGLSSSQARKERQHQH